MYSLYKHEFDLENYLDCIENKKFRIALTKFRLSSQDLAVERGRYDDTNRNDRICKFCNGSLIENEYHFLLVCPLYRELRQRYMKPYFCHWPTLNKFDELMSKRNINTISNLSKFIYYAFKSRQLSLHDV